MDRRLELRTTPAHATPSEPLDDAVARKTVEIMRKSQGLSFGLIKRSGWIGSRAGGTRGDGWAGRGPERVSGGRNWARRNEPAECDSAGLFRGGGGSIGAAKTPGPGW